MLCMLWTNLVMPHVTRSVLRCHCGSSDKSVIVVVEAFHNNDVLGCLWRELYFPRIYWELITIVGCTEKKKKNPQLFFYKVNGVCLVFWVFFTCSQLSFWILNVFHYNWNFIITNVILSPPQFCYTEISLCVKCSYKKWRQTVQKYCYVIARKTDTY
jgi:hypothetical protein